MMEDSAKERLQQDFPTDVRPAARSLILLLVVIIALCVFVSFEKSSELVTESLILFGCVAGVAAFTQRHEPHRIIGIVVAGIILSAMFLFLNQSYQPEKEVAVEEVRSSSDSPHSLPLSGSGAPQDIPVVQPQEASPN